MNPQFAQIAPPNELSVLLCFQIRIHESTGVMALCLPYRSIETVAPSLTAHSYFSGQRTNDTPLSTCATASTRSRSTSARSSARSS